MMMKYIIDLCNFKGELIKKKYVTDRYCFVYTHKNTIKFSL